MIDIKKYPIKFVSMKTGLNQLLIRTWENRYSIVKPERTNSNRRLYSENDIEKLTLTKRALENGLKIGDIAGFSVDELKKLIEPATIQKEDIKIPDSLIEESILMIIKYDTKGLQNIVDIQSIRLSRFDFIQHFIYPLMMRIGDYWETGQITVSHEHFASAIIRSSLGKMIVTSEIQNLPTVLIGTPANESHELMALSIAVLVSHLNVKVIYLGSSVPADEIVKSVRQTNAKLLILSIISQGDNTDLLTELEYIEKELDIDIIVGGSSALNYLKNLKNSGIIYENSIDSLLRRIETYK